MLSYGSVCSGIEAASVAWSLFGWEASFLSEIDKFPRAVLAHHYPHVPLHGDFTTIRERSYDAIDLLVGGTPCQSFSVAGLRAGLDDDRGNLALEFLRLAGRLRPRWLVWENVPGVLSSSGGRDFGSILGGMVELGYGFAYRVLDAQFVRVDGFDRAVPQRRRRVFVVGHFGDWHRPAAVLFERESLCGHPAPRRETGQRVAASLTRGADSGGKGGYAGRRQEDDVNIIAFGGNDTRGPIEVAREGLLVAHTRPVPYTLAIRGRDGAPDLEYRQDGTANAILTPNGGRAGIGVGAIAFTKRGDGTTGIEVAPSYDTGGGGGLGSGMSVAQGWAVRRLTPTECERLQGFPDGYTAIPYNGKPAADGPRYKALGNSMAVNCMRWIGHRISAVEGIITNTQAEAA